MWRRRHGLPAGSAAPVWIVGLQRSGTNLLVRVLGSRPEIEVRNENDRRAFDRFRLRDPVIRELVARSRHRYVLCKPLCDSHRVDELLDGLGTAEPGRAIWVFRNVDDRARSAVAKFGRSNLTALRGIAAGEADSSWQGQRLSDSSRELIAGFDYDQLTEEDGAALFWYVRNRLYFELGLHERDDVLLFSYDDLVARPSTALCAVCRFLDLPREPTLGAEVDQRADGARRPLELAPAVRARCDELGERLTSAYREKIAALRS